MIYIHIYSHIFAYISCLRGFPQDISDSAIRKGQGDLSLGNNQRGCQFGERCSYLRHFISICWNVLIIRCHLPENYCNKHSILAVCHAVGIPSAAEQCTPFPTKYVALGWLVLPFTALLVLYLLQNL